VLSRFEVASNDVEGFLGPARAAVEVLLGREGCLSVDLGRNLDEPSLWTITSRWRDVGSYRRALQGYEAKVAVVPLLSRAVDEPSAYEHHDLVGENHARGAGPPWVGH